MNDQWNDADAQDQFEREQRIWERTAERRKNSQSSLLWGFGAVTALIVASFILH